MSHVCHTCVFNSFFFDVKAMEHGMDPDKDLASCNDPFEVAPFLATTTANNNKNTATNTATAAAAVAPASNTHNNQSSNKSSQHSEGVVVNQNEPFPFDTGTAAEGPFDNKERASSLKTPCEAVADAPNAYPIRYHDHT
jgi:hypothetical protein